MFWKPVRWVTAIHTVTFRRQLQASPKAIRTYWCWVMTIFSPPRQGPGFQNTHGPSNPSTMPIQTHQFGHTARPYKSALQAMIWLSAPILHFSTQLEQLQLLVIGQMIQVHTKASCNNNTWKMSLLASLPPRYNSFYPSLIGLYPF